MKTKFLLAIALCLVFAGLAVTASAYDYEAPQVHPCFTIRERTAEWNPDGTIAEGEYFKVELDQAWFSYCWEDGHSEEDDQYAKDFMPELYMSYDGNYVYTATRYTVREHENRWDHDPGGEWQSGCIQLNYANYRETESFRRLEYGVGLSSDTGDILCVDWSEWGYDPKADGAMCWYDEASKTLTYETRVSWDEFSEGGITSPVPGGGFNFCIVWSIGTMDNYVAVQLADGCTGFVQFKEPSVFAEVTLAGRGYETAWEAADAIGSTPIVGYTPVDGIEGVSGAEGPANLWDGSKYSKYCVLGDSDDVLYWSSAMVDEPYSVNGVILATSNDSREFGNRLPVSWTVYGSNDGENWTVILSGGPEFFDEYVSNYTFYVGKVEPATEAYTYFKFEGRGTVSDAFQLSECVLCSASSDAEPAPEYHFEEDYIEMEAGEQRPLPAVTDVPEGVEVVDVFNQYDGIAEYSADDGMITARSGGLTVFTFTYSDGGTASLSVQVYGGEPEPGPGPKPEPEPEPEPTYSYPSSGTAGLLIRGQIIGNKTGWDKTEKSGAASAFDGNPHTFFDPLGVGDGYCGIDAGRRYVLTKAAILPREGFIFRFEGAMIQGSNDGRNWTTLWKAEEPTEGLPGELLDYALGARVTVSSVEDESGDYNGENAVDGDMETRWSSGYTDDETITVDLGDIMEVGYIQLFWEVALGEDFEIYASMDGGNLYETTLAEVTGNGEFENEFEFEPVVARFITIHGSKRGTEFGFSLYEIVVRAYKDEREEIPQFVIVSDFENNNGYSMFRYYNETNHGDVAEVEFYGIPVAPDGRDVTIPYIPILDPVRPAEKDMRPTNEPDPENIPGGKKTASAPAEEKAVEDVPTFEDTWENPFTDVKKDSRFYYAVRYVYSSGIMKGVSETEFDPDGSLTRAMLVTILGRMDGVDPADYTTSSFTDVDPIGTWDYAPYVEWAAQNGIVLGYGDGRFGPNDPLTREQAIVMLARYARYLGYEAKAEKDLSAYADRYDDAALVSDWAKADVAWAIENEVYPAEDGETEGMLGLKASAPGSGRAWMAETIYNFVGFLIK